MSTFDPAKIRRVGVAIELQDGQRVIIYSDDPRAEVEIKTTYEEPARFHGDQGEVTRMASGSRSSEITISNLGHLVLQYFNDNSPGELIDSMQKKLTE